MELIRYVANSRPITFIEAKAWETFNWTQAKTLSKGTIILNTYPIFYTGFICKNLGHWDHFCTCATCCISAIKLSMLAKLSAHFWFLHNFGSRGSFKFTSALFLVLSGEGGSQWCYFWSLMRVLQSKKRDGVTRDVLLSTLKFMKQVWNSQHSDVNFLLSKQSLP